MVKSMCETKALFNALFWEPYFKERFVDRVAMFVRIVEERLLPAFEGIEDEAEQFRDRRWNEICNSCGSPDSDLGDFAEKVEEDAADYYMALSDTRQAVISMAVASLYHLFEQQTLFLLRREVLDLSEEDDVKLMKIGVLERRLAQHGILLRKFDSWPIINEMRLVCNVIKHAEGGSALELRALRPDLFENPMSSAIGARFTIPVENARIYLPLLGEDLYPSLDDLKKYGEAIGRFWDELWSACMPGDCGLDSF